MRPGARSDVQARALLLGGTAAASHRVLHTRFLSPLALPLPPSPLPPLSLSLSLPPSLSLSLSLSLSPEDKPITARTIVY